MSSGMKKPTLRYIAYPDKSWIDHDGYDAYPAEHRMRLDGATCILYEQDFKDWAYRKDEWWKPVKIGTKVNLPRLHFIVWREIKAQDKNQYEAQMKRDPDHFIGAACVIAASIGVAEQISNMALFWNPVDPNEIERGQAMIRQEREALRAHYPEAW